MASVSLFIIFYVFDHLRRNTFKLILKYTSISKNKQNLFSWSKTNINTNINISHPKYLKHVAETEERFFIRLDNDKTY
jgi:hypothetical protein